MREDRLQRQRLDHKKFSIYRFGDIRDFKSILEQPNNIVVFLFFKKHSDLQWLNWKKLKLEIVNLFSGD